MKLIDLLPPQQRRDLRRMRKRIARRLYMRRVREQRKLLCVGVDLPIDAGTCGRFVHDGYLRCIQCTRRRWWLLTHALNPAEVAVTVMLEQHAAQSDALYGVPRWLRTRALGAAEDFSSAMLEEQVAESDAVYGVPRWLRTRALGAAEDFSSAMLEEQVAESDAVYGVPEAVPILEDVADPCLRW